MLIRLTNTNLIYNQACKWIFAYKQKSGFYFNYCEIFLIVWIWIIWIIVANKVMKVKLVMNTVTPGRGLHPNYERKT